MASQEISAVAILSPKPGKLERLAELLKGACEYVEKNEPRTLMYKLHREINVTSGSEELVVLEKYQDAAAQQEHRDSAAAKALVEAIVAEDLATLPPTVKVLKEEAGFLSR